MVIRKLKKKLVCHMKYKGHPQTYLKEMVKICCYKYNCDILVYLILL